MEFLENSETFNSRGNELYKNGYMDQAIDMYSRAVETIKAKHRDELRINEKKLLAKYYSNRAQTRIQLQEYEKAVQDCTFALELDPNNMKAMIRRGMCYENLGRLALAVEDMKAALSSGHTPPALTELALTIKARAQSTLRIEKKKLAEEGVPSDLVHENQALRLILQEPFPSTITLGEWFTMNIRAANEFGLWYRPFFEGAGPFPVQVSLIDIMNLDKDFGLPLSVEIRNDTPACFHNDGKGQFYMRVVHTQGIDNAKKFYAGICFLFEVPKEINLSRPFLPVASMPITLVEAECGDGTADNAYIFNSCLGCMSCRLQYIPGIEQKVLIAESPGQLGIGGKVWDAGLVLLSWISENRAVVTDKTVLELGTGTGWVGIGSLLLGAGNVTLTDLEEICPLVGTNIQLNIVSEKIAPRKIKCLSLPWGQHLSEEYLPSFDSQIILMSDVVYDPELYQPLISTLENICSTKTKIYMAHRHRNPEDWKFFASLEKIFSVLQIELSKNQQQISPDVKLFLIQKHLYSECKS